MEKEKIDLSIIILSYNSKTDLERLLPSVFSSQTKYSYEVIVVDNGSADGTDDWLKEQIYKTHGRENEMKLKIIKNINNGFAAGNNLGIKSATGKYILILNPDTKLEPNTLETMLHFMEARPEVGMSGCKIIKGDGTLDLACRRRFPNLANSFKRLFLKDNKDYNYADIPDTQEMEVDSLVGAFMAVRRSVIDRIGLLDEKLFMYGEDLDWCWRCKEAGFKVWYCPKAVITHFKGSSSKKTPFKALKWSHEAMWIFYKKHYAAKNLFLVNWLVCFGIYLRLAVLIILNTFKKSPGVSK